MLELCRNSWYAKLYQFFYVTDKLPNNLCPFFWKLVIMFIFIVPVSIINLPVILLYWKSSNDLIDSFGLKISFGLVSWIFIYLFQSIFFAIAGWIKFLLTDTFFLKDTYSETQFFTGNLVIFMLILSLGYCLIQVIIKKNKNKVGKNNSNVIKEFIKAKYFKYCPKINWK